MKAVVFLSLICACAAFPQVYIAETPAVQMERQRHFQLFNAAAAAAEAAPDINVHFQPRHQQQQYHHGGHRFATPQHHHTHHQTHHQAHQHYQPQYTHKSATPHHTYHGSHNPSYQPHYSTAGHSYQKKWTGPLASSQPAGLPGSPPQVQDTPEVLAAKRQFGQAYQNELRNVFG